MAEEQGSGHILHQGSAANWAVQLQVDPGTAMLGCADSGRLLAKYRLRTFQDSCHEHHVGCIHDRRKCQVVKADLPAQTLSAQQSASTPHTP